MACEYEFEIRVGGFEIGEGGEDGGAGFLPGCVEAFVYGAGGADGGGGDGGEVEGREVVAQGLGAAEGEDDKGFGGGEGEIACYVRFEGAGVAISELFVERGGVAIVLFEFEDAGDVVCFDEGTIAACLS